MTKKVTFRDDAAMVYYAESYWYEHENPGLGSEFQLCVDAAIEIIQRYNTIGRKVSKNIRRVLLRRFPFSVYYQCHQNTIEIIAIRHLRRNS